MIKEHFRILVSNMVHSEVQVNSTFQHKSCRIQWYPCRVS